MNYRSVIRHTYYQWVISILKIQRNWLFKLIYWLLYIIHVSIISKFILLLLLIFIVRCCMRLISRNYPISITYYPLTLHQVHTLIKCHTSLHMMLHSLSFLYLIQSCYNILNTYLSYTLHIFWYLTIIESVYILS